MAAEIQRQDLISDEALFAPAILAKNLEAAVAQLRVLKETSNEYNNVAQGGKSMKSAATSAEQLTKAQQELAKVEGQIATVIARTNAEYIAQTGRLKDVQDQLKQKIALGDRDTKTISKQNASIQELGKALEANRKAYSALRTEEERNSKTGKELLNTIQQQDTEFKELRKSMGQAQDNVGNYEGAIKELRNELKSARGELVTIANTLGTGSKEFVEAAERAGALKDQINEVEDAIRNAEASPFENLSNSLGDVGSKLLQLDFGGAAASARQFANASRAITFKEALTGIKDFGTTLTTVGRALLTNPLFLLAAVIGGIVVAIVKFRDSIVPVKIAFDVLGRTFDFVTGKLKEFTDWLGLSTFAQDEKRKATEEAASKEIAAVKERYDREIRIAQAAGKDIAELERKKQEEIKAEATKGLNALIQANNTFRDEDLDKVAAYYKEIADANTELTILQIAEEKQRLEKIADLRAWKRAQAFENEKQISNNNINQIGNEEIKLTGTFAEKDAQVRKAAYDRDLEFKKQASDLKRQIDLADQEQLIANIFEYTQSAQNILSAYNENLRLQSEEEIAHIEAQREYELQLAGDNKDAQDAINRKFNAEVRKQQKEQAERDKRLALFNIAINTAQAITKALPNIALSILVGVLGGIQAATVSGIKLPAFAKGTDSAPGGLAIVGEKGSELVVSPSGKASLTPGTATLTNLQRGSKVFTHEETTRILAMQALQDNKMNMTSFSNQQSDNSEKLMRELIGTIKNKKELQINITRAGLETAMKNAESRRWFLDNIYG